MEANSKYRTKDFFGHELRLRIFRNDDSRMHKISIRTISWISDSSFNRLTFATNENFVTISLCNLQVLGHFLERPFMTRISLCCRLYVHEWTHEITPFHRIAHLDLLDLLLKNLFESFLPQGLWDISP